jgi:hypothetical protein
MQISEKEMMNLQFVSVAVGAVTRSTYWTGERLQLREAPLWVKDSAYLHYTAWDQHKSEAMIQWREIYLEEFCCDKDGISQMQPTKSAKNM